jgi:hypothetical protein
MQLTFRIRNLRSAWEPGTQLASGREGGRRDVQVGEVPVGRRHPVQAVPAPHVLVQEALVSGSLRRNLYFLFFFFGGGSMPLFFTVTHTNIKSLNTTALHCFPKKPYVHPGGIRTRLMR